MSKTKHSLTLGLVIWFVGSIAATPLRAADPRPEKANWDNLKQLAPGEEIRVVLNDAKSYRGQLQAVNDEAVVVRLPGGEQTFARQSVLRVSSKRQGHRTRNGLIGAAAGAAGGAGIGAAACPNDPECQVRTAPVGLLIGLGVGATAGALLPTGGWHDVYRAR